MSVDTESLFIPADSPAFREMVAWLLVREAPRLRSTEPAAYVKQCRKLWVKTRTDKLYSKKFIMDGIFSGNESEFHCATIAEMHVEADSSGTQWREPKNYHAYRKPLGRDRFEFIHVYPTDALQPEPDSPEVSVQLVALFDLLGFENKLKTLGLRNMYTKYQEIIHQTFVPSVGEDKHSPAAGMFAGQLRQGYLQLPIRHAYFSDTLLMWAPLHNAFVGTFLDRCSSLFCNAIETGFPLRGAISVGEVVFHKKTNTYLGEPLVEAARLEAAQDGLGVALGESVRNIAFPPDRVQRYNLPVKQGKEQLLSGLSLDWPKYWRDFHNGSASEKLRTLQAPGFEKYFVNAINFVDYSDKNSTWFHAELEKQIGAFTPAKAL